MTMGRRLAPTELQFPLFQRAGSHLLFIPCPHADVASLDAAIHVSSSRCYRKPEQVEGVVEGDERIRDTSNDLEIGVWGSSSKGGVFVLWMGKALQSDRGM